ncbi:tyrosine-type recombinase/integrase [Ruminococcus sp.]|uniref:tyrosine-type recombinase/integrase n=1 Tax=Ruminococcus sp. TaxID=41978 RepID=UPI00388F1B57
MATIRKRNNSYQIGVSCGYDINGKQIMRYMTYTPEPGMTAKQIKKELDRQAVLFEESCTTGQVMESNIKFADFSKEWMKHKKAELRPKTYATYDNLLPRINAAIGHMRIDRIQPQHLLSFYENLAEGGIRNDTKYKCRFDLGAYMKEHKLSKAGMSRSGKIAESNILSVTKGNNCAHKTAVGIAAALNMPLQDVFTPVNTEKRLSAKTILHYHRLISSILSTAVEWGILFANPCERVKPPRVEHIEPKYLDEIQAAILLDLLESEDMLYKTAIRFLLFTGLRRGEALGLNWSDINFDNRTMQVCRSSLYLPDKGIFEDDTKNRTSNRVIKLPLTAINDLKQYRTYQRQNRLIMGDRWQESDRIFTTVEGAPLHPDTLSRWFSKFIKAHSDKLPPITLHSLRHTNATLQIAGGVPITTVSKRLGHADTTTTGKIYAHAIKSADEAAAETLENILTPTQNRNVS